MIPAPHVGVTSEGPEAQVTIETILPITTGSENNSNTDPTVTTPLDAAVRAQSNSNEPSAPMYAGLSQGVEAPYTLYQLGQQSFEREGSMSLLVDAATNDCYTPESISDTKLRFYQLNAKACKDDLQRSLENVSRQVQEQGKELLGGIMFSCGARGPGRW